MGGFISEAPPGLDSRRIRCCDDADYPKWVLHIINQFRHTRELLNPVPSFTPFAHAYDQNHFFVRKRIGRIASLRGSKLVVEADTAYYTAGTGMISSPF